MRPQPPRRLSVGVPGLDEQLGGGIPAGDAVLIAGPSGSGKTMLSVQFVRAGAVNGERGIIAVFEEHPGRYLERANALGWDLEAMVRQGQLKILYLRLLDLSVDETLQEIRDSVRQMGAERVVIDSLSGFELALAPSYRDEFRESLYRMVRALTGVGVTTLMTVEVTESYNELRFSSHAIAFLVDDIILQRYVEMDGQLRRVLTVAKMRGSEHSKDLTAYEIADRGLVIGEALDGYRAIMTGLPRPRDTVSRPLLPGLTASEATVLEALIELREAPAESLASRTGLRLRGLRQALGRLVALNYATMATEQGRPVYRPAARTQGQ